MVKTDLCETCSCDDDCCNTLAYYMCCVDVYGAGFGSCRAWGFDVNNAQLELEC